jgi:hypothetical protein
VSAGPTGSRFALLAALAAVLVTLLGCGLSIPSDPDHTLDRVRGGVLRVGASPSEPWLVWGSEREPTGVEAELVRRFADSLDARVEWSRGGEEVLINRLERGELDLVVGGLTAKTPWSEKAAITKPYASEETPHGKQDHVLAAPLGENAFLVELERFLLSQRAPQS